ncbi:hypothetical protein [Sphingobium sp. WCS2017Hpa-17]|nr:hypothetical protein [Sphingobium sp. WCS2017Hpa-17]
MAAIATLLAILTRNARVIPSLPVIFFHGVIARAAEIAANSLKHGETG